MTRRKHKKKTSLDLALTSSETQTSSPGSRDYVYTVGELSRAIRRVVEESFGRIRVRGEISQLRKIDAGHYFFRLKDESALIEVVCWRNSVERLKVTPQDGLEVICIGRLTTYLMRSLYQFMVTSIELAGQGALLKILEERKRRLADEGLFDVSRKRPLPFLPEVIGVVTSPNGVVIHDIVDRLNDRFPRRILLWPVTVEGKHAAGQVAAGIKGLGRLPKEGSVPRPDVIIVARGGGSLEDLMPFNEEVVVRAAVASSVPLISAIGHETDTTLLDHAADVRAPTPTAAAEIVVPVRAQLIGRLFEIEGRLLRSVSRRLAEQRSHVAGCTRGMRDPQSIIGTAYRRLDAYTIRLGQVVKGEVRLCDSRLVELTARLRHPRTVIELVSQRLTDYTVRLDQACKVDLQRLDRGLSDLRCRLRRPQERIFATAYTSLEILVDRLGVVAQAVMLQRIVNRHSRFDDLCSRLSRVMRRQLDQAKRRFTTLVQLLESLSYKKVLQRGYAVVRDASDGGTVTSSDETTSGQKVVLTFHDGDRGATIDDFTDKDIKRRVDRDKELKQVKKCKPLPLPPHNNDLFTQEKI